jgi:primosomal protein N'
MPPLAHSFHSSIKTSPRLCATELYNAQKKKPRFSQQAHARKKTIGPSKKRKPQPWDSGKSIDDLESTLLSRWGTLEGPTKAVSVEKKSSSSADFRRPVFDPWGDDEKSRKPLVREYYDEDDEGFEYAELEDDEDEADFLNEYEDDAMLSGKEKKNRSNSNTMKIGHLVSPKPVGGRGTNQVADEPTGSYFFNPKSASPQAEKKSSENASTLENTSTAPKKKKPNDKLAAEPLVDENGNQLLLTLEEAMNRFESTVDDDTMDTLDSSEESPIVALTQKQSWEDLGITSPVLLENLEYMNCPTPLAVQEKSIPPAITGNDVLVGTYTGSGKTLSFLTPLVQRLLWNDDIEKLGLAILIIAPGRELASQIVSVTRELIEDTGLTVQLAIGGTTFSRNLEQIRKRKPNIIVGTPGRIAELVVGKPGEK